MLKSLVCVLALAVTATGANAQSMSVNTADLDLSTEAGAKKLDQRILSAARKLCASSDTNTGSRLRLKSSAECVKRATAEAREKIAALKVGSNS